MYRVKITYATGCSDTTECTQAEARKLVSSATFSMIAGRDGIVDVVAWEV
jgi:hypothetical protein